MIMFPVSITGTLYTCVGCMATALFSVGVGVGGFNVLCFCFFFLCWWVLFIFL